MTTPTPTVPEALERLHIVKDAVDGAPDSFLAAAESFHATKALLEAVLADTAACPDCLRCRTQHALAANAIVYLGTAGRTMRVLPPRDSEVVFTVFTETMDLLIDLLEKEADQ